MSTPLHRASWKISLMIACLSVAFVTRAAEIPVAIGISGWTGFAPLTLADKAGIFKKHGLDVDMKMIPQRDRHLAVASGAIQCAATTVETYVSWAASGVVLKQIVQLDKSYGADGLAVRNDIKRIQDLKGKTIGVDAPGTSPYFALAWMLDKNGMSMKDVKMATLSPQASAQAFIAGQNDAAMSYEPYLSTIRQHPQAGKILATTLDYPMVMDTLGCTPAFLQQNPQAGKALVESYFDALAMIKSQPEKSYEIMGAAVKSTGKAFAQSASYLRWQDREQNRRFFNGEIQQFSNEAAKLLLEAKVIRKKPDISTLYDASYVK
ncbi:ABC transporter substrate-binding protein [Pectobacteriaceae bacterium CE70]|uniref:ABC transporter permease n=1 Tax=Serratia sp. (strain ATCC 39006) TaxID=104623 RepID=A0A2I5T686_SERS3|nr:ABC transporter substrate-binding protein [Serratia sp. ATCC 39006]AUH00054.1 ABC transporter permease [Serratia sp. ATCC 39006]AUH04373.1 ABC transporter permease [Serratia sp. ATCC 39006]WJV65717.1 ABC transporter substrate-binding protein [Pectobacteriaceae bacterium CE70]WJY09738.1 ABC transporter substrate-binding protein [Pectobacteriaceae bacterium C80]